jgi:predicted DCC family thiol-disulfide oxidoreductase YuxK
VDKGPVPLERIFYDGRCGLCHWAVRFVARRDLEPIRFRYAPLHGQVFRSEVTAAEGRTLPDSMAVRTADGRFLTRSAAVLHVLRRLGGGWRFLARLAAVIPAALRDRCYDAIARVRHRLFAQPAQACPLLPDSLRGRFDE